MPEGPNLSTIIAFSAPVMAIIASWQYLRIRQLTKVLRSRRAEAKHLRSRVVSVDKTIGEIEDLRETLYQTKEENERLKVEMAQDAVRLEERENALKTLQSRMETDFQALAAKLLETSHASFLARANETFERHATSAAQDVDVRRKALEALVGPMGETLERYEKSLGALRQEQAAAQSMLIGRMSELASSTNQVRDEAQKLRSALSSGTRTAGRWGEEQLRNVVEAAGMSAYVDYAEQSSFAAADDTARRQIPDMVVNLPGGRKMAVDAKVSISAYLEAAECDDADIAAAHLARHGDDLWAHVKTLSSRDYAASLRDSLDMVIMFVPGENYFAAALDARPALFQDAFDRKVMIATPMTLVAMLKAASFHWRQEKAAEHAAAVAGEAKGLYDSLKTMAQNFVDLGRSLDRSVHKYNAAMAGFDKRVLVRARRFAELELPGVSGAQPNLSPVDTPVSSIGYQFGPENDMDRGRGNVLPDDVSEEKNGMQSDAVDRSPDDQTAA